MTDDPEREDWDALIRTPGWCRLKAWAKVEMETQFANAANNVDDDRALRHLQQVIASKRMIERLLEYPGERVKQLQPREAEPLSYSRAGA